MNKGVLLTRSQLKELREHAKSVHPEECIGVFECQRTGGGFEVLRVFPCRNVARHKSWGGMISKPDKRNIDKIMRKGSKSGLVYGVYHSHPITGTTYLSERDKASGRWYKMFKLQIVLGAKNPKRVCKSFWEYRDKEWFEHTISLKKNV